MPRDDRKWCDACLGDENMGGFWFVKKGTAVNAPSLETNSSPLKINGWEMNVLTKIAGFSGAMSVSGMVYPKKSPYNYYERQV